MEKMVRVVCDGMGGDNAPESVVQGVADALNEAPDIRVILVGQEEVLKEELKKVTFDPARLELVNATEVIEMAEPPANAIRKKKDSSIVVGMNLVREKKADAFVTSGSTGATLVGAMRLIGNIKGIMRTPLAPLIPTENGVSLLVDCGANVDARPEHLVQFAEMGSIYMKYVMGISDPKVAIVNNGAEEEKGNALVKATYPLLKEDASIHFVGSIEAREIPHGGADVIVCEAFTGNVILKLYEGVATTLLSAVKKGLMSTLRSKIGGLLIKPALKKTLKAFDANQYGGAPLLGLNGLVVKSHGSAKRVEIKNTILQCRTFMQQDINGKIKENLKKSAKKPEEGEKADGI